MLQHIKNLSPMGQSALFAGIACITLYLVSAFCRPIFPVDETRYLTVAWEMHQSGNWILPTLNYEPYHHKPPVLFWAINLLWSVFGVAQQVAMIVPYLCAFALLLGTARLATRLFPKSPEVPLLTVGLFTGSLPFVIYSNLIMFDLLLSVWVIFAITAIWDYIHTRDPKQILVLGLCIGLGLLSKGPVVLLHFSTIVLLAHFWAPPSARPLKPIIWPITKAILIGIAIALCWAIPAAIEGGKEFADKIFWGQTAGRMVNAFDHNRPVYWYLMFLPLFVLPWISSPAVWRGMKSVLQHKPAPDTVNAPKFLAIWAIPVFAAFCLISGKQVHYLIPLLPSVILFLTAAFLALDDKLKKLDTGLIIGTTVILTMIPVILKLAAGQIGASVEKAMHAEIAFAAMPVWPSLIVTVIVLALGFGIKGQKIKGVLAIAVAMMGMISAFQMSAKEGFYPHYDLAPMAAELAKYPDSPLAFVRNYHGEFGFLGRLDRPVQQILPKEMKGWFAEHPNGLMFIRTKNPAEYKDYNVIYKQPYRLTNDYVIVDRPN